MLNISRKVAVAALLATTFGVSVAATSTPAAARGWGAPVAAGIIGGLALGAIAASANAHAYYPPPAAYYPPAPAYYPVCQRENQPTYDQWGNFVGWRPVRVCN